MWCVWIVGIFLTKKRAQTSADSHISDNGHSSSLLVRTAKGVRLPAGHICFLGFGLSMNQGRKKKKNEFHCPSSWSSCKTCMCLLFPGGWRTLGKAFCYSVTLSLFCTRSTFEYLLFFLLGFIHEFVNLGAFFIMLFSHDYDRDCVFPWVMFKQFPPGDQ